MSNIAFIQPIFAPDKKRLDRNLDSIKSLANYLKANPYDDINFYFGGWCKDEYWATIKTSIKECMEGKKFSYKRFSKNYGKAVVVNNLHKMIKNEQYILTADSDILFLPEEHNMFERLIECHDKMQKERKSKTGVIALNQKGQNCHLPLCFQNVREYENQFGNVETVNWPNGAGGIAGGCIFVSKDAWKKVGGYREMGVYSGDDAYLLLDMVRAGRTIQLFSSLHVVHPMEDDAEYAKWKVKVCQRDSGKYTQVNENQLKEAEEFWSKHSDD